MNLSFPCFLLLTFGLKICTGIFIEIGVLGGLIGIGYKTRCYFMECCTPEYIEQDIYGLKRTLKNSVYGQHIAVDVVSHAIEAHWRYTQSKKPLTLSFHGWTGSGKNYVTKFIVDHLFTRGDQSKYVHNFVARIHFTEESKVREYQLDLYSWIRGNVSSCPHQVFIFDEVNLMPKGLLDGIKPLLDYSGSVNKVDYRQCIFIFISNTGGSLITKKTIELWNSGKKREDITLQDFEGLIRQGAFNEKGGFQYSDTIKSNLIDHYIPFLPLEREHIEMCIIDEFRLRGIYEPTPKILEEAINFVEWGPTPENKFSTTGCKRLSQKVAMLAQKIKYQLR